MVDGLLRISQVPQKTKKKLIELYTDPNASRHLYGRCLHWS